MVRNYSLEQHFKVTDENARDIKNIKVIVCASEEGVENSTMESMFKDFAAGFVDYLHTEGKVKNDNTSWDELESMFSNYTENDAKNKGWKGWFK